MKRQASKRLYSSLVALPCADSDAVVRFVEIVCAGGGHPRLRGLVGLDEALTLLLAVAVAWGRLPNFLLGCLRVV